MKNLFATALTLILGCFVMSVDAPNTPIDNFIKANKKVVLEECNVKKIKMIPSVMMATAIKESFNEKGKLKSHIVESNNLYGMKSSKEYHYDICWNGVDVVVDDNNNVYRKYVNQWWSHRDYTFKMQSYYNALGVPKDYMDYIFKTTDFDLLRIIEDYELYKLDGLDAPLNNKFFNQEVEPTSLDINDVPKKPKSKTVKFDGIKTPPKIVTVPNQYTEGLEDYDMLITKDSNIRKTLSSMLKDFSRYDEQNFMTLSEAMVNNRKKILKLEKLEPRLSKNKSKTLKGIFKKAN